ncbi:MAG TPA: c-type cytochrome domain-containing protein [Gemmataceae bacterium]|jgi:WD40 repeat protein|nr:c-type cytochrome domain-containing protein [Gemmataceae bacterium]
MHTHFTTFAAALTLPAFLVAQPAAKDAPSPGAKISYYKDVRPIFQQHCQGCHQPAKPGGGFVMTSFPDLFRAGDSDMPGVVAGKPQDSLLVKLLHEVKGRAQMPKGKDPLPEPQIKLIADWVAQGAADDTPESARAPLVDAAHPPTYELLPVLTAVAFSPDGQLLAVSGYHEVLLHRGDGSGLAGRLIGLSERIQSIAFSPDGKTLAVSGGDPGRFGEIQLWDVAKKTLRLSIPLSFDTVYGVSWSPDNKLVACGCADNTVRAFDAETGKQVLFQGAHSDWVMSTAFSQDGQHLVSISRDRSVKLTEVPTNRFIDNVTSITPGALKGGLLALDVRPAKDPKPEIASKVALAAGQPRIPGNLGALALAAVPPKKRMTVIPPDAKDVPAKVYDELLFAGADGVPRLYKMHREVKRVIGDDANKLREYEKMPGRIYAVAFDKTGRYFVAGSSLDGTGEARVFEVDTAKRVSLFEGVKTPVYSVAFRPDGKLVATAGFDGVVRLSDPMTGKLAKEFVPVPEKK